MKKRFFVVAAVLMGSSMGVVPSVSHAETGLDLGWFDVRKLDEGYDQVTQLFGNDFDCVVTGTNATHKLDRSWFEGIIDGISGQKRDYIANPGAGWNPVNPPTRTCEFKYTVSEANKTSTYDVTNDQFGTGSLSTVCNMNFSMDVSFIYKMTIPREIPGLNMLLPNTSAQNWLTDFSGTRKCTWTITFGSGSAVDKLSGTVDQDFGNLPRTQPRVSANCNNFQKTLCVGYTYTSNLAIQSGEGKFAAVKAGEGFQVDVRVLPAALINMPFELDGNGATVISQSVKNSVHYPRMSIAGVSSSSEKLKSVITLRVTQGTVSAGTSTSTSPSTTAAAKSYSAKALASVAKLKVLSTSKVTLKVASGSSKNCRVVGSSVRGVKSGSCRVVVTVKPKKGKTVTKTITVKISK